MNMQTATPAPCFPDPTSRPSSSGSRPPGPAATTPSSARRCRSSARRWPRPPTCAAASASSTSLPATATPRSRRRGASPTSPRPTTCPRCSTRAAARAAGRRPGDDVPGRRRRGRCRSPTASFDVVLSTFGAMFAPDHAAHRRRDAARAAPGRPARHGQLDARRLHRPAVQAASAGTCRRPPGCSRRPPGAPRRTARRCSARSPAAMRCERRTSTSATARRRTSCRCSATTTARRKRPSRRSTPAGQKALEADLLALLARLDIVGRELARDPERVPRSHRHQALRRPFIPGEPP